MESLFLLAFGEEEFLAALGMTGSETFFNKLLKVPRKDIDEADLAMSICNPPALTRRDFHSCDIKEKAASRNASSVFGGCASLCAFPRQFDNCIDAWLHVDRAGCHSPVTRCSKFIH